MVINIYTVATTISTICGNYFTQHIPLHISISISRVDARLINFFAPHLAPLARTYSTHHPSRTKENQR